MDPVAERGGNSELETDGELFNDWIGEDLAGDALDFELGLGRVRCERVFEGKQEVLSLADVGDTVQANATECAGDGLALGIEDSPLQCDIHVRLHEV